MATAKKTDKRGTKEAKAMPTDKVAVKAREGLSVDIVVRKKKPLPLPPPPPPPKPVYEYAPGRPMKFQDLDELQRMVLAYFEDAAPHWIDKEVYIDKKDKSGKPVIKDGVMVQDRVVKKVLTQQKPLTITGLAVALGTTRETLLDYEKTYSDKYQDFSDTIKDAKEQIKEYAEMSLFGSNATGPIFNLKNNWGWKDKYETENTNKEVVVNADQAEQLVRARAERRNS